MLTQTDHDHRPAPGASQRRVPAPRHNLHHCAAPLDEPSTRVQAIRPSGLPLARGRRMDRQPLRLFLELRTPPLRATHVEAGTDLIEHGSEICSTALAEPPTSRIYLIRATSRRTRERGSDLIDGQASSASARGISAANAATMKESRLTTPMACAHGASARLSSPTPMISSATASRAPSVGPRSSWATPA